MKPRNGLEQVELLNVPHYRQGDFDGLCAYYSGAMMLASLYPRFSMQFGELLAKRRPSKRALDPMIRHYEGEYRKAGPGKDDRYILARTFYEGQYVQDVRETLNNVMKHEDESTRFEFRDRKVDDQTFYAIAKSIDRGLPALIGWETADYGNHAVLVKGYCHGDDDWLLLNDPGGTTRMSWQVLRSAAKAELEVVLCKAGTHSGPRPDKALTPIDGTVEIHRWMPEGRYVPLDQLFRSDQ